MKKLMMMAVAAVCALPTMAESGDSLVFETIIANPVTRIKDLDLCESFVVNKTYIDRADRNVRTHGDASFSQGGSFYDVIYCMANYGLIPE